MNGSRKSNFLHDDYKRRFFRLPEWIKYLGFISTARIFGSFVTMNVTLRDRQISRDLLHYEFYIMSMIATMEWRYD